MSEREVRERDILVAPNEYAYVQDLTKGDIVLYVGPTKISLSNTERVVELRSGRFVPVRADAGGGDVAVGVSAFVEATGAQYVVLENPPKDPGAKPLRGPNASIELLVGRKVVVPGPASFPLWPGQRASVIDAHALREDEYLVVSVYDAIPNDPRPIGHQSVVRGSETSLFVPVTGLEVLRAPSGFVRKAHRLRTGFGLHVRVLKAFEAQAGDQLPPGRYAAGQDLFLTEREGFFFPTENLEVVSEVAPIPIDERQGLYVREIATGRIEVIEGPASYLPDPTKVAVVAPARSVTVPSGFAVLVTSRTRRRVVRGPTTCVLAMGEELETLRLSTGRPKTSEKRLETALLQTSGNKVSDVVRVETRDHNDLEVTLSYRVSFVGDEERWFHVEDYVALLCDHLGSLVRAAGRRTTLEQMQQDGVEIVRSAVLGDRKDGAPRPGRHFEENGMLVYDVEVLEIRILDAQLEEILGRAQHNAILADVTRREEALQRGILASKLETLHERVRFEEAQRELQAAEIASRVGADREERLGRAKNEADALLAAHAAKQEVAEREADLERRREDARVAGFERQMAALAPELVTTLKTLGHQALAAELSRNVSPPAILGGESVSDVVERLLGSLPMASGHVRDALPARAAKR